ncbi:acyl-CoA thioesterase [Mycolicibacterium phlei]|jgi:acyl-CoA thioesterase
MTVHPLDEAVHLEAGADGTLIGRTTTPYANMVGPFGGTTAAALLHAVELHPERAGDPVALTVNYAAPIAEGGFQIDTTLARRNRTNQHWIMTLSQQGGVMTTATAVFGIRRETWSDTEAVMPNAPDPDSIGRFPTPEGIPFMRNYDMRYIAGPPPLDGAPQSSSTTTLWVRDDPRRALDFVALTALSDIFYPRAFRRLGRPLPAGTISLTTYFHVDGAELAAVGDDFVLATARALQFARGYFDQTGQLWSRDGKLLVTTHQTVYYKDSFGG